MVLLYVLKAELPLFLEITIGNPLVSTPPNFTPFINKIFGKYKGNVSFINGLNFGGVLTRGFPKVISKNKGSSAFSTYRTRSTI